ncbi:MAG: zinc transporter ZupT [Akkermansia sp.]|nr:zinc transporter ZupT [Akkermansia sp.]
MNFSNQELITVFLLTTFAGLATGIGGMIAYFMKQSNTKMLTFSLGFSGGVMVYISLVELFNDSKSSLIATQGESWGSWIALIAFFGGIALAALIDYLIPEDENPHEARGPEDIVDSSSGEFSSTKRIKRSGILFALAIGIHNFPEGIATFAAGLDSLTLGTSIALAVAVHNIPEGMAVSVPLFYGTGSRKKALFYTFLSGLAEPIGALIAMVFLLPFLSPTLLAILFSAVAGIMVFISFDELLPMAERWGHHHISILGIIAGMLIMALVLI